MNGSNPKQPNCGDDRTDPNAATADALNRLDDYWYRVSPRRHFRRNVTFTALTTCAVVLLSCWQLWRSAEDPIAVDPGGGVERTSVDSEHPNVVPKSDQTPSLSTPVRPTKPIDEPAPRRRSRRPHMPRSRRQAERQWLAIMEEHESILQSAIARVVEMFDDVTLRVEGERLAAHRQYVLTRVPYLMSETKGVEHEAVVGLLAEISGPDTVELLIRVMKTDKSARERLLPKVVHHTPSIDLVYAYRVTTDRVEMKTILAELGQRNDRESARALLVCMSLGKVGATQLKQLLHSLGPESSDRLFRCLTDSDDDVRWEASVVLAKVASSQQIVKLQQMVVHNRYGVIAAVSLLLIDTDQTRQFLTGLSRDVRYVGLLRSAANTITRRKLNLNHQRRRWQ